MSLTDPTPPRPTTEAPPSAAGAFLAALILAAAGFATAYGFGWIVLHDGGDPPALVIAAIVGGMFALVVGQVAWWAGAARRMGGGLGFAATMFWIPAGAGLWLVSRPDPEFTLPSTLAACFAGFGVLMFVAGVASLRARRKRAQIVEEMMRDGHLTQATVTYTGTHTEDEQSLALVTFTFHDHAGTQRWVRRLIKTDPADPITEGRTTRLWYDPDRPGDQRRIVVELERTHSYLR